MTEKYTWVTSTPEQVARSNALEQEWREQAEDDPTVVLGAATTLFMNTINIYVPRAHRRAMIEAVYNSMRLLLDDDDGEEG